MLILAKESSEKFYNFLRKIFTQISHVAKISRVKINSIIQRIKYRVYSLACQLNSLLLGDIETDESYFGPKRVRGKRGTGSANKIKIFGLLKIEGNDYFDSNVKGLAGKPSLL